MRIAVGDIIEIYSEHEPRIYYHYPFATDELKVPVEILQEYPNYFLVMILPHENPKGFGMSRPYKTTITKNDFQNGWVKVIRKIRSAEDIPA